MLGRHGRRALPSGSEHWPEVRSVRRHGLRIDRGPEGLEQLPGLAEQVGAANAVVCQPLTSALGGRPTVGGGSQGLGRRVTV